MSADRTHVLVNVVDNDGNELAGGFLAMAIGESRPARAKFNVWDPLDPNLLWVYRFNPVDFPGSSFLVVTRVSSTAWVVQTADGDSRARLIRTPLKSKAGNIDEGVFAMPFAISVVRPQTN
jgi:hypothetical protein